MKLRPKTLLLLTLILVTFFFETLLYFTPSALLSQLEYKLKDAMFLWRGEQKAHEAITILDIDERSLEALGQWPWSRDKIAKILNNLTQAGAGIIGLDIVFAEEDASSPHRVLASLGIKKKDVPNFDEALAHSFANSPLVAGYVFAMHDDGIAPHRAPPTNAHIIERNKPADSYLPKPYRTILNTPLLQQSAYSSGYFNTIPDRDGVVRSVPLIMEYDGVLYPALSLEMIRLALGSGRIEVEYDHNGVFAITVGELVIPTDTSGRLWVNYRGGAKSYPYISALDIYENRFDSSLVEGKIMLFGTSSTGLLDLRSTPFESAYPGVEVHANALDNMLTQNFIARGVWSTGTDLLTLLILPLIGGAILFISSVFLSSILMILLLASLLFTHYYLMFSHGVIVHTFTPLVSLTTLFFGGILINYFFESRQKELIKAKFARKVSPDVVDELIANPQNLALEGKEAEITVFFSDVRDFTSISEKLHSARDLIALLNDYMTPMVEIIARHHGTIDKFIGDAIMAYWNAPKSVPKHADKALSAAIEQILSLAPLNEQFNGANRPNIRIGIGLNSGLCVVGEMGSLGRSDYTCIGDAVNLASRIEGLCKSYGAQILLSEFTLQKLEEHEKYELREIDFVRVKGKTQPVRIYECLGYKNNIWKENPSDFAEALKLYRNSDFKGSLEIFKSLNDKYNEKLYELYLKRCEHYIIMQPKDFDGVFEYTTK